ncbi:MAG: Zn-ribbon domain-containing OB-fold protein [Acidimicrobiia bacterium]|nr:Zn-ribbon domain-containing OB-fold protein [Acidimicrobiia bacterium]
MDAVASSALPEPDPDTEAYWDAAADGRLLLRRCRGCGEHHFYPRPFCPHCWSDDVEWVEASGRATLYTFSIVRRNDLPPWPERVPYVPAVVDLAEGPRMMTNVVGCDPDDVRIDMDLVLDFRDEDDGVRVPVFRPARAGSQ